MTSVLIVADERTDRLGLASALRPCGFTVARAASRDEIRRLCSRQQLDVAVLDWEVAGREAADLLAILRDALPRVVVLTSEAGEIAGLQRSGASQCLIKPFSIAALANVLQGPARGAPVSPAETVEAGRPGGASALVASRNPVMNRVLHLAWRTAESDASILLLGESGTGKTALARAIHERSRRREAPFVTVHCPCLHPQLLESQLFGHVRGAFTGAVSDTMGRAAAADGGTLFLDEVGDLPLELQPKLLRLLQDREFERVGDFHTQRVDIRVIAATHRNLADEVAAGRFREDLYYRLNVVALRMVPLRRRPEDILPSAGAFLAQCSGASPGPRDFAPEAQAMLQAHGWPGNLRELRNTIERAAILSRSTIIERADLLLDPDLGTLPAPHVGELVSLAELEQAHIRRVLSRVGNYRQAAQILGIDKSTLYRKVRQPGGDGRIRACA